MDKEYNEDFFANEPSGLSYKIIGAAIEVHKALGPGLLESAYENCLAQELNEKGLKFGRQVPLPVFYKGRSIDCSYCLDFLVENSIILELKSVEKVLHVHVAQLLTYLRLAKIKIGFLLNFNVPCLKDGIYRRVL